MLYRVTLVKADISEERSTTITKVIRNGELRTTLAVISNQSTLRNISWVRTRAKMGNIPEGGILLVAFCLVNFNGRGLMKG
jgi:hypothetical protein